jgi:hypothetical protein
MPISSKKQSIKLRSDPEGSFVAIGFAGGLNTLVSPQHLKDNECSILLNGVITEDGVITRRPGTLYYDSVADGNRVLGLFPFTVTSTTGVTTRYLLKMDDAGNLKKLDLTTKTWSTITGKTYTAGYNTELTQSYSTAYIGNGQDNLTKTDGSTITQFSSVADPSISTLTVTATGTTGSSNYSYGYTLQTSTGETLLANTNGGLPQTISITNGNATLSASNYNLITITRSSDANVTGYNVYGRTATNIFYMVTLPQTASGNITWKDDGTVTPDTFQGPPDQNSTSGVIGSIMQTYHETMFVGGIKGDPSRVYYSAGLDKFDDFQIVNGGGSISVNSSDGDEVTAIVPFKDKIVFFKNRSSYMFQFNTGSLPTVTVINPHIGCNAPRTAKVVLNDLFFLGAAGTGVFTLGYQQGYYGNGIADMLRTNEVSIKIHPTIASMNSSRIQYAAAIYSPQNYKYILAYADGGSTYNNMMAVYDTRYGAWVQWDGLNANCFCNFIDSDGKEHILYGDDNQGRVNELFVGNNDNDGSFTFRVKTKDFNNNSFHLLKTFVWPTFHFRYIKGLLKVTVITDGVNTVKTANITSTTGSYTGWSYDRWANFLWGTTTGNSASATSADAPRQLTDRYDARSIMFLFENTSATDTITLLGVECKYITRAGRRLPSQFLIQ